MTDVAARLQEIDQLGLSRRMRMISGPQGPSVVLDGEPVLLLCSNNYLGLSDHPRVREAAAEAARRWGVGAGASRLVSGTMTIHRRLEDELAALIGSEACVLFGSGYLANIGVIGALTGRGETIFSDELNHASLIDGARLSRAEVVVYRHRDMEHLESLLERSGRGGKVIVTDSLFSMDGTVAPLEDIVELARDYGAQTIVDEAHAIGVLGPGGRGVAARAGLEGEIDVIVGTLGKSLGSYGAFACANEQTVRLLVSSARPLVFSTAPAPPAVAGALAALKLMRDRPDRVSKVRSNARALRGALAQEGFPVGDSPVQIIPLIVGDEQATMDVCRAALERGVFAQGIRPPTVPSGTGRLRLTAMATHGPAELADAAAKLAESVRAAGLDPEGLLPSLSELETPRIEPLYAVPGDEDPVDVTSRPFDFETLAEQPLPDEPGRSDQAA